MWSLTAIFLEMYGSVLVQQHSPDLVVVCGGYFALLEYRVMKSVELNAPFVVFTGGFGEAENAEQIFLRKGGSSKVLLESNSTTTKENADFTVTTILRNEEFRKRMKNITIVSDGFHGIRCLLLFQRAFPNSNLQFVAASNPLYLIVFKWSLRECLALVKGLIKQHYTMFELITVFKNQTQLMMN